MRVRLSDAKDLLDAGILQRSFSHQTARNQCSPSLKRLEAPPPFNTSYESGKSFIPALWLVHPAQRGLSQYPALRSMFDHI